jgi:hypothetical protein
MTSRPPPVPPENRTEKGTGDRSRPPLSDTHKPDTSVNPDEKGQQGNSKINTVHPANQQDR